MNETIPRRKRIGRIKTDLWKIPGIGELVEPSLVRLGYRTIKSLRDVDPESLYEKECLVCGHHVDRRLLYRYRCAVYFANNPSHPDPEKLEPDYWKD